MSSRGHETDSLFQRLGAWQGGARDQSVEVDAAQAAAMWPLLALLTHGLSVSPLTASSAADPSEADPPPAGDTGQANPLGQLFSRLERVARDPKSVSAPIQAASGASAIVKPRGSLTIEPREIFRHDVETSPTRLFERAKR